MRRESLKPERALAVQCLQQCEDDSPPSTAEGVDKEYLVLKLRINRRTKKIEQREAS
jgi:hypothetical protein